MLGRLKFKSRRLIYRGHNRAELVPAHTRVHALGLQSLSVLVFHNIKIRFVLANYLLPNIKVLSRKIQTAFMQVYAEGDFVLEMMMTCCCGFK
jgi:hypothetical protein